MGRKVPYEVQDALPPATTAAVRRDEDEAGTFTTNRKLSPPPLMDGELLSLEVKYV